MSDNLKDHDLLIRIEGKIDGINSRLDTLNGSVAENKKEIDVNRKNIDSLRQWRSFLFGAWAIIMIVLGAWMKWG